MSDHTPSITCAIHVRPSTRKRLEQMAADAGSSRARVVERIVNAWFDGPTTTKLKEARSTLRAALGEDNTADAAPPTVEELAGQIETLAASASTCLDSFRDAYRDALGDDGGAVG